MACTPLGFSINRRRLIAAGGAASVSLLAARIGQALPVDEVSDAAPAAKWSPLSQNTVNAIQEIIQAEGTVSNGVLSIEVDRDDIPYVTKDGVPIDPAFQINGTLVFQGLSDGRVAFNGDMALKAKEIGPFIDRLVSHQLVFQAEHQHFYDFSPMVWFIHFRRFGNALQVARAIKAALNVTSTPFPQTSPPHPSTPLPAEKLGQILGATPSIGAGGVVTFELPRREPIQLGGIRVNPFLNIASSVVFQPHGGGENAAAAPDYGLLASEVNEVVAYTRALGWDIGCLYNQETDEHPQLYFSHQFKTGNSVALAKEIRGALNRTNVKFS